MKILSLIIIFVFYSCNFNKADDINRFRTIYKGMDKSKVRFRVNTNISDSLKFTFNNKKYTVDIYDLLVGESTEGSIGTDNLGFQNRSSSGDYYEYYVLYFENKLYFQGFIWEYRISDNFEIYEIANIIKEEY